MDLKTARLRLKNNFYRREAALLWDLQQIAANAAIYNGDGAQIARDAKVLVTTFQQFMEEGEDPMFRLGR